MKKYLIVLFVIFLAGCEKTEKIKVDEHATTNSSYSFNLTEEQSESIDELAETTSETLNLINSLNFDFNELTYDEKKDYLSNVLASVQEIEQAYVKAGGKKQDEFATFLQESPTGFYQICSNMIGNSREYTETEAFASLSGMSSFIKELSTSNGFIGTDTEEYLDIFLKKLSAPGKFSKAVLELL